MHVTIPIDEKTIWHRLSNGLIACYPSEGRLGEILIIDPNRYLKGQEKDEPASDDIEGDDIEALMEDCPFRSELVRRWFRRFFEMCRRAGEGKED